MSFKKAIALFLMVVMLVSSIPLAVFAGDNVSVSFDKESYKVGEAVNVTLAATGLSDGSWFGVYSDKDPLDSSVKSIVWGNISDFNNKTFDITKTLGKLTRNIERKAYFSFPAGGYTIAVFNGSEYELEKTFSFKIEKQQQGETSYSINLNKTDYNSEESVMLTVNAENYNPTDWVGIYLQSDNYGTGAGTVKSILWFYIKDGNNKTVDLRNLSNDTFVERTDRGIYESLPQGNYIVYVFENDDYNVVASETFTVQPPAGETKFDITLNKTSYSADESVLLSVSAQNYNPTAWVGVYLQSDTYGEGGVESIVWYYISENGDNKTVDLTNLDSSSFVRKSKTRGAYQKFPSGDYIVYVFEDGGYNVVESATFSITGGEAPNLEPFINTDKTSYLLGESVNITAGNGVWVGVYAEDEVPAEGVSRSWYYISQANQIPIDIMSTAALNNQGTFAYKTGNYVAYLFGDEGYSNILAEASFTISGQMEVNPADYSLEVESDVINFNSPLKVKATGTGIDGKAWVGLYKEDDNPFEVSSYYWFYISGNEGQQVDIFSKTKGKNDELEPGVYKLIIFANDTHTLPVLSLTKNVSIVKEADFEEILSAPTCENNGLKRVTYKDGTTGIITIPALGGEHKVDEDGFEIIKEPTCTEPGLKEGVCSLCGTKFTVEAEAYGHLFTGTFLGNGDGTHSRTCSRKGCDVVETKNCVFGSDDFAYGFAVYRSCSECDATSIYSFSAPSKFSDKITVTNHAASFAGQYEMRLCNEKGTVVATRKGMNASELFSGLTAGTNYKVQVRIINDVNGVSKISPWASTTSPTLPKANALSSLVPATNKVTVKYGKVKGVTGYQIQYSTKSDFASSKTITVKGDANVSKAISSLKHNTKYYFRVRTYKTIGGSNYFSAWSKAASCTVKPIVGAVSIKAVSAAKKAFTVKRTTAKNISGYQLQYSTNAKFTKYKTITVKNTKELKRTVKNLKSKTVYYVRVRGFKTVAKKNYAGVWSAVKKIKTK